MKSYVPFFLITLLAAPVSGAPVRTGPPNVPSNRPAFPQQSRAPEVRTRTPFQVTQVASGLRLPWAVAFLPDGRFLITQKHAGQLVIVTPQGEKSRPIEGIPRVDGRNQGGLMDVELAPDFERSRVIYWSYYEPRSGGNGLAVARGRLDLDTPKVDNVQIIFRMQPTLESTMHAGGRIVFAPDGNLFITLGERSILPGRRQAQDLGSDFGKIVRIRPDGSIPPDNPFVHRKGARPEIWSYGHRNVLGAALDGQNRLWAVEMGPRGGDELNHIQRGRNYGWPTIGYGEEYSGAPIHKTTQARGMEQPVYYWDPVISPSSLAIYSGKRFPEWRGNYLIGGLSSEALIRLVLRDDRVIGEERLLTDRHERIRDVSEAPDGTIYILTDDENGRLLRLTPR